MLDSLTKKKKTNIEMKKYKKEVLIQLDKLNSVICIRSWISVEKRA